MTNEKGRTKNSRGEPGEASVKGPIARRGNPDEDGEARQHVLPESPYASHLLTCAPGVLLPSVTPERPVVRKVLVCAAEGVRRTKRRKKENEKHLRRAHVGYSSGSLKSGEGEPFSSTARVHAD